ncbi:ABC-2 family transporter protein [Candidatus Izimaplasma bacterium HR1]|jgi:fluoroquinolone transport system permease protein|uniref:ABC transporter permease n=1 Tax=Candidatus Izimoplasma sp. HR1 TaxID=1541959 RepID=UPI0004F8403E|nr:ABC-2 family transporter protein [Candidatus Izimaplasma bacterium HR1]
MSKVWLLVKGELQRLHKYNLTTISLAVAILWCIMLYFVGDDLLGILLPLVLLMDATMMALMYVGSIMTFEKSESTISTLLVTPVSNDQLLLAKVLSNTVHNMFSSALIIIAFTIFASIEINYLLVTLAVFLSTATHTVLGICMSYTAKDFTRLLMRVMSFAFILMAPALLLEFGVVEGTLWEIINLVNPINAALELFKVAFPTELTEFGWEFYFSLGYLLTGGPLLYFLWAKPKFQDYAVRQSGV